MWGIAVSSGLRRVSAGGDAEPDGAEWARSFGQVVKAPGERAGA
jgi:hypothetical protein